jgi:hypothetical protein
MYIENENAFYNLAIEIFSFSRRIPRATWAQWMRRA